MQQNFAAVDAALAHLHKMDVPAAVSATFDILPAIPDAAPTFVRNVLGKIAAGFGDDLPVSALPAGGTFPTATAQWESGILHNRFRCGTRSFVFSAANA